jgi:hypothetical protein
MQHKFEDVNLISRRLIGHLNHTLIRKTKLHVVSGEIFDMTNQNLSVSKSDQLHGVIIHFYLLNLE